MLCGATRYCRTRMEAPRLLTAGTRGELVSEGRHATYAHGWTLRSAYGHFVSQGRVKVSHGGVDLGGAYSMLLLPSEREMILSRFSKGVG